jgi:hypothetical protein
VAGSCEYGNLHSGSIKDGEFIDQLLRKVSTPRSLVQISFNFLNFRYNENMIGTMMW